VMGVAAFRAIFMAALGAWAAATAAPQRPTTDDTPAARLCWVLAFQVEIACFDARSLTALSEATMFPMPNATKRKY
jgi:hypothetical protein